MNSCQCVLNYKYPESACPQEHKAKCDLGTVTTPPVSSNNVIKTGNELTKSRIHVKVRPIASILKVPALKNTGQNATQALLLPPMYPLVVSPRLQMSLPSQESMSRCAQLQVFINCLP